MTNMSSSRGPVTDQAGSSNDLVARKAAGWNGLWGVLFVGLISVVLCAPFARYVGWLGDEGVLLQAAERMAQGSTIYVDFFEFLPPGGFVLTQDGSALPGHR